MGCLILADDRQEERAGGVTSEPVPLSDPEFKEQLVKFGMDATSPHGAEQFAAVIKSDVPRWTAAVKASGATVD